MLLSRLTTASAEAAASAAVVRPGAEAAGLGTKRTRSLRPLRLAVIYARAAADPPPRRHRSTVQVTCRLSRLD
jgi:hypothetical protein